MGIFSDAPETTVFKSEAALDPEFLPARMPHREGQIDEIAKCIRPALRGSRPENMFVSGPPGVGKTAVAKFIFQELSEFERVRPLYINCWQYNTRHAVLSKILNDLGGIAPRRGVATDEVFERAIRKFQGRVPIVCLDEADQLIRKDGSRLFYDLLRANQSSKGTHVGILAISNNQYALASLDSRVKSSLSQTEINFPQYSSIELADIICDRADLAFRKGFIHASVLSLCARETEKRNSDVRFALDSLLRAGRLADNSGGKLTTAHYKRALSQMGDTRLQEAIKKLSTHERTLLRILASSDALLTGDLYKKYSLAHKSPVSDRTFRNYLSNLSALNLINAPETHEGYKGKSRLISLKIPKDCVAPS